ncbi:PREDICTED: BLOC-1-related complex subunit 8 homolog [Camelina sativa]|uniref:BLOC-1-related complex subunit 8 homolog n=1 Tax=Camelina sativa TaxID=90675 RepID=A0ABM0ZL39_CAMSA|nr:PREDICTED: BLOC-1-related complex subunit 8 homolog [Camelina sativa]
MHEFSTVDGFAEINESLAEMIKYIANEPSVGLYYIQQHVRNAAPNVLNLNTNVLEKSRETGLHTEDLEDSIAMVKSMRECGSPIADDMIGDIKNSLSIMSSKQPRRGVILSSTNPWSRSTSITTTSRGSDYSQDISESNNLFTSVFKTAKEKASNIKWPQLDFKEQKAESNPNDVESNELKEEGEEEEEVSGKGEHIVETTKFEEFKAGKEASLKAWLGDMDGNVDVGERVAERI